MYFLTKRKNMLLKVLSLLFIFHTILFAEDTYDQGSLHMDSGCVMEVKTQDSTVRTHGKVKIAMNGFGGMSMTIMVLLTSLLGAFFMRNEFTSLLD